MILEATVIARLTTVISKQDGMQKERCEDVVWQIFLIQRIFDAYLREESLLPVSPPESFCSQTTSQILGSDP